MKISKSELKKRIEDGWEVEEVKKAPPKKKPKKMIKEQVVEGIQHSSEVTNKSIMEMVEAMKVLFNEQMRATSEFNDKLMQINDKEITVKFPEQPKVTEKKKSWKFSVERDGRGFITNITAEEV